ncbi:MAG TPA: hypothetical protein VIL20_00315 [Sandaracinaceae bacterium]
MSEMVRGLFLDNPAVLGSIVALLVFVAVFVIAAVRAVRAEQSTLERVARLPLENESPTEAHHG